MPILDFYHQLRYQLRMEHVNDLEDRLLFAIPKQGRLYTETLKLLSGSDIQYNREDRHDIAFSKNHKIALIFLRAGDIPFFVARGHVDLGITGTDQLAEFEAQLPHGEQLGAEVVLDLGFGSCKLQVQVPREASGDPRELVGKRIATSFVGLSKKYFEGLEAKVAKVVDDGKEWMNGDGGEGKGKEMQTSVLPLGGSVETACALGAADGIVDLVESGQTMVFAGLKAIDTVLNSSAVLIKSKSPTRPELVDVIAKRITGVINAQKYVLCKYNIERSKLSEATKVTPGKTSPTIDPLEKEGWVAVSATVESKNVANVMDELTTCGAIDILVLNIVNSRTW